jgi:CTP:phosphocholine cytidylyltransferase-like protein
MNYAALSDAIQAYTENTDATFIAEIPVFVQQAEQRIYNTIQFPSLRKNVTGSVTNNNKYLACPNDFLSVYSLALIDALGSYEYLLNKDVNFIRQAYPNPNDTALPKYYALFGSQSNDPNELTFILGPTPDATYVAELHYFYYPESIVTASTTWLGDNFDSVLLYGSLVEAYTYMKGEQDIMALYNGKYQEALALAKRLGDGLERQDAYRSGQYRQAVT